MFVSGGLLLLHLPLHASLHRLAEMLKITHKWHPPFRAYTPAIVFFFISNVFLAFAPLIPPAHGFKVYERLPYWVRRCPFIAHADSELIFTWPRFPCTVLDAGLNVHDDARSFMFLREQQFRASAPRTGTCAASGCLRGAGTASCAGGSFRTMEL